MRQSLGPAGLQRQRIAGRGGANACFPPLPDDRVRGNLNQGVGGELLFG